MNLLSSLYRHALAFAVAVAVLALAGAVHHSAPITHAEQPEITYQWPQDGDIIKEPPVVLHMCFKNPVNVKDLPPLDVGDFAFSLTRPDNVALGMRIVFQPDGYGVAIYPGTAETDPPEGEWVWTYHVVDAASGDPLDGTVRFTVNAENGADILPLDPPPAACLPDGATPVPTGPDGSTPTSAATPASSSDDDDSTSALTLVLVAVGIAAAALVVGVMAFLFRSRNRRGGPPTGGSPPPPSSAPPPPPGGGV